MESEMICLSYGGTHEVHKRWMRSIGEFNLLNYYSGFLPISLYHALDLGAIEEEYDVVVCEDGMSTRVAILRKLIAKAKGKDLKLVRIFADKGVKDASSELFSKEKWGYSLLDGGIAVSEIVANSVREFDIPLRVVYPFIPNIEDFLKLDMELKNSNNVLFVGRALPFKNVGSLVDAVSGSEFTLHLVGNRHKEYSQDNVITHGYVEDLTSLMEKCDLYVQPSRFEAFGVAPAEAMAAGIPAIVTSTTGIKDIVGEVDEGLIAKDHSPEALRDAIQHYYAYDVEERRKLGDKSREVVKGLEESTQTAKFKKAVNSLIE